jgi:hypothetical protein
MARSHTEWKDQRDKLLADTLAFVQQVATDLPPSVARADIIAAAPTEPSAQVPPSPLLPVQTTSLRADILARVERFKAQQHALKTTRDADYDDTIERVRAVTRLWR